MDQYNPLFAKVKHQMLRNVNPGPSITSLKLPEPDMLLFLYLTLR